MSTSGGVMLSLPGQNGQASPSRSGNGRKRAFGLSARSGAMITHRSTTGSFRSCGMNRAHYQKTQNPKRTAEARRARRVFLKKKSFLRDLCASAVRLKPYLGADDLVAAAAFGLVEAGAGGLDEGQRRVV